MYIQKSDSYSFEQSSNGKIEKWQTQPLTSQNLSSQKPLFNGKTPSEGALPSQLQIIRHFLPGHSRPSTIHSLRCFNKTQTEIQKTEQGRRGEGDVGGELGGGEEVCESVRGFQEIDVRDDRGQADPPPQRAGAAAHDLPLPQLNNASQSYYTGFHTHFQPTLT